MKISGELDYRIRYDVEHDLFHAQNVFSEEYITPTFIEYVQKLEKENNEIDELKAQLWGAKPTCNNCGHCDCENYQTQRKSEPCALWISHKDQLTEAKEIISGLLSSCFGYNSKTVNYEVKAKAEQFIKEEQNGKD